MNIKIRNGYKEDYDRWDDYLNNSNLCHVLQSNIMSNVWNYISFKPHLIIIEKNKNIIGGLMSHIYFGNSKLFPFFRNFLYFRSQYGPIISNQKKRLFILKKMISYITKEIQNYKLMSHLISTPYTWGDNIFLNYGYKFLPNGLRYTFIVNLQNTKRNLWKSLSRDKQRGVNKAKKFGVEIREGKRDKDLEIFYKMHLKTTKRLGILPDPYLFIRGIWKILVPRGNAKFLFAYYKNKPIAVLCFLIFSDKIYTYISGSLEEYHNFYPNNLLMWRTLEYGLKNGFEFCDLMGSPGPEENHHPEYGLYKFKKGWGGKMVGIRFFSKVFSPKALWIWNLGNSMINRYPSFLTLVKKGGS